MSPNSTRRALASLLIAAFISSSAPALAQDDQRAAAREVATEGARAFQAGKYAEAVELFTKAESLFHALPHLLYIARAHAKLGQYVKSREAYLKITKEQLPPTAAQAARDAQTTAASEVTDVESKIGRLTVTVEGKEQAKDLVVMVNGVAIAPVLIGLPQPVDPGDHKVDAIATGFRAPQQIVTVPAGGRVPVVMKLAADATAAPPVAAAPAAAAEPAAPEEAPPQPAPGASPGSSPTADAGTGSGANGLRIGSYVAFGVGAVGLGLGTVFLIQSGGTRSDADALCTMPNGACGESVKDQVDELDADANTQATIGAVGLVTGAIGVATGITLFVLSGKNQQSARVMPWIGPEGAGVTGTF